MATTSYVRNCPLQSCLVSSVWLCVPADKGYGEEAGDGQATCEGTLNCNSDATETNISIRDGTRILTKSLLPLSVSLLLQMAIGSRAIIKPLLSHLESRFRQLFHLSGATHVSSLQELALVTLPQVSPCFQKFCGGSSTSGLEHKGWALSLKMVPLCFLFLLCSGCIPPIPCHSFLQLWPCLCFSHRSQRVIHAQKALQSHCTHSFCGDGLHLYLLTTVVEEVRETDSLQNRLVGGKSSELSTASGCSPISTKGHKSTLPA